MARRSALFSASRRKFRGDAVAVVAVSRVCEMLIQPLFCRFSRFSRVRRYGDIPSQVAEEIYCATQGVADAITGQRISNFRFVSGFGFSVRRRRS